MTPVMVVGPLAVSVQSVGGCRRPGGAVVHDLDERQLRRDGGVGDGARRPIRPRRGSPCSWSRSPRRCKPSPMPCTRAGPTPTACRSRPRPERLVTAVSPVRPLMGVGPAAESVHAVARRRRARRSVVNDLDQRQRRRHRSVGDGALDHPARRHDHADAGHDPALADPRSRREPRRSVSDRSYEPENTVTAFDPARRRRVAVAGHRTLTGDRHRRRRQRPVRRHPAGSRRRRIDDLGQRQRRRLVRVGDGARRLIARRHGDRPCHRVSRRGPRADPRGRRVTARPTGLRQRVRTRPARRRR